MVDHGAGRFSGVLDRHYTVAPANLVGTCELSSELDFLALEFSPDAFEEHGTRGDLALQLRFMEGSESMGNHDSKIVDACCDD